MYRMVSVGNGKVSLLKYCLVFSTNNKMQPSILACQTANWRLHGVYRRFMAVAVVLSFYLESMEGFISS